MSVLRRWAPLALMAVLAGCGGGATKPSVAEPAGPTTLRVTIADGEVKPRGARVDLLVGQPLTLSVRSDAAEEIHVHSDPEREFEVKPGRRQQFTLTVDRPGKVAVEVHDLDVVVAEVLVRK
ncbi:MAG: hypothetical protein ACJ71Z_05090 [Aeromicrobium sp.]